jgi:aquaporin TIP
MVVTFGHISTAISHAFSLSAAVYIGARISAENPYTLCGHANPAVTFGTFLGGNIHFIRGLGYWIAQLLASVGAYALLTFVTVGQVWLLVMLVFSTTNY